MTAEGATVVQILMRSPRPDVGKTPRRSTAGTPPGVVTHTNVHDVNSYLLQSCLQIRSIYVTDNPFLSRVKPADRLNASLAFIETLSKLKRLETLSLQRSFISNECLTMLCERWRDGRFPSLCQLNVNQNLISDEGFLALADCLISMPSTIDNIKVWALNQLRPSSTATHQRLAEAIVFNTRVINFDMNWRTVELLSHVTTVLDKRRSNYATSIHNLKSALVEVQSQTPHLKVFRLADNEALSQIWSQDIGDSDLSLMMQTELALPRIGSIMSALGLLATNYHLVTLELPGNGLRSAFVEFFFEAVVHGGSFRSVRHLNLERNRFNVKDVVTVVSLLDVHYAFEELNNECALMPFESLRLAGQEGLRDSNIIERDRDLIFSRFICNHSLNDLTLDVSQEAMEELRVYLQRNEKKHRSRIVISSINQQVRTPFSTTIRRQSIALKQEVSPTRDKVSNPPSPKARFLFSPKSPVEDPIMSVDTIDDIMVMVARESPTIEDFTLSNSRFLCCLNEADELRFSRALVSLLAYNFQLHTIALSNCGIRDPFLLALITAKTNGDFPNLVVLDFNQNSLSDGIILSLLQSPVFELKVIRLRHRSTICSPRMGAKVLTLLKKYHRRRLRVFEFDFDDAKMQRQAEQMLSEAMFNNLE